jgi:hypothetical protein
MGSDIRTAATTKMSLHFIACFFLSLSLWERAGVRVNNAVLSPSP